MNHIIAMLFITLVLPGCATQTEVREVKVPVPVTVSCPDVPKPGICQPKDDSRQEWLRCELVNHERLKSYAAELEAVLKACQ